MSQEQKENIDQPKMTTLEDLLNHLDAEIDGEDEKEAELSEEEELDAMFDNLMDEEEDIDEEEE